MHEHEKPSLRRTNGGKAKSGHGLELKLSEDEMRVRFSVTMPDGTTAFIATHTEAWVDTKGEKHPKKKNPTYTKQGALFEQVNSGGSKEDREIYGKAFSGYRFENGLFGGISDKNKQLDLLTGSMTYVQLRDEETKSWVQVPFYQVMDNGNGTVLDILRKKIVSQESTEHDDIAKLVLLKTLWAMSKYRGSPDFHDNMDVIRKIITVAFDGGKKTELFDTVMGLARENKAYNGADHNEILNGLAAKFNVEYVPAAEKIPAQPDGKLYIVDFAMAKKAQKARDKHYLYGDFDHEHKSPTERMEFICNKSFGSNGFNKKLISQELAVLASEKSQDKFSVQKSVFNLAMQEFEPDKVNSSVLQKIYDISGLDRTALEVKAPEEQAGVVAAPQLPRLNLQWAGAGKERTVYKGKLKLQWVPQVEDIPPPPPFSKFLLSVTPNEAAEELLKIASVKERVKHLSEMPEKDRMAILEEMPFRQAANTLKYAQEEKPLLVLSSATKPTADDLRIYKKLVTIEKESGLGKGALTGGAGFMRPVLDELERYGSAPFQRASKIEDLALRILANESVPRDLRTTFAEGIFDTVTKWAAPKDQGLHIRRPGFASAISSTNNPNHATLEREIIRQKKKSCIDLTMSLGMAHGIATILSKRNFDKSSQKLIEQAATPLLYDYFQQNPDMLYKTSYAEKEQFRNAAATILGSMLIGKGLATASGWRKKLHVSDEQGQMPTIINDAFSESMRGMLAQKQKAAGRCSDEVGAQDGVVYRSGIVVF